MNCLRNFSGTIVLFALAREARPFLRYFSGRHKLAPGTWQCHERLVTALLGVGPQSARLRVNSLLQNGNRPRLIVVAGYAGALKPGLPLGTVCSVAHVRDAHSSSLPTSWPEDRSFHLLTSERMIIRREEKSELYESTDAELVDMESYQVVGACQKAGIHCGCVRVVSDIAEESLPDRLTDIVDRGRVSYRQLCTAALRSPSLLAHLIRLGRRTSGAAQKLADNLYSRLMVLESTEPWEGRKTI